MSKLRAAIIGLAHIHAILMIRDLKKNAENVEVVGMADYPTYTEEELKTRLKMNVPEDCDYKVWENYKDLLNQNIDIAIICTDVKDHAPVVEETLAMGIHTVVEKPMALDMNDAKRMWRAYKKSKADLIINWPVAWIPAFRKAKQLADSGVVGDVLRVQYRSPATRGPYKLNEYTAEELSKLWWYKHERGGGSVCDYAGYGCLLTTWISGKIAKRVSGLKKNFFLPFSDVEDYSIFTIDFGDCVGLVEGSWSTINSGKIPTGPVIYGTEGIIVSDRYDKEILIFKELKPYCSEVEPTEIIEVDDIDEDIIKSTAEFINGNKPLHELLTPEFNMKAMAAFDAGRRSCETGMIENAINPFQF